MQFDNGHFKKCNDWLASRYGEDEIIDWNLVPTKKAAPTPPSGKENSSTLANVPLSTGKVSGETPSDDEKAKSKHCPVADEFDDADALEALVEAQAKEGPSGDD